MVLAMSYCRMIPTLNDTCTSHEDKATIEYLEHLVKRLPQYLAGRHPMKSNGQCKRRPETKQSQFPCGLMLFPVSSREICLTYRLPLAITQLHSLSQARISFHSGVGA